MLLVRLAWLRRLKSSVTPPQTNPFRESAAAVSSTSAVGSSFSEELRRWRLGSFGCGPERRPSAMVSAFGMTDGAGSGQQPKPARGG